MVYLLKEQLCREWMVFSFIYLSVLVANMYDTYAQHFKIILSFGSFTIWIIWIITQ